MKQTVLAVGCTLVAALAAAQMKPQTVQVPATSPRSPVQITSAQQINDASASARRITREEAMKQVKAGTAVYLDVRSKETYDKGHIKGAYSTPRSQLMQKIREVPPGKTLITYCACEREHTAALAVLTLNSYGVKNAAALVGGWNEWTALGLPIEKAKGAK
jgi:rhodanese-related sulfurtransferase